MQIFHFLIKSIWYRLLSMLFTFFISFLITKNITISFGIGLADAVGKILLYFVFEVWWESRKIKPCVIWLTGLPCSGKTTLANSISKKLASNGIKSILLDGDEVRNFFRTGFDKESRIEHNLNVGRMASLFEGQGYIVLVSLVSPYKEARDKCRQMANRFFEIYVATPLSVCESRDVKGMYKQSRAGELKDFTGIDAPYEIPENPDLIIHTDCPVKYCTDKIFAILK